MLETYIQDIVSRQRIEPPMAESSWFDIIKSLDGYTQHHFAWEIASEVVIRDKATNDDNIMTTVTLYMPGGIFTGRSLCFAKDYANNHLYALVDACKTFTSEIKSDKQNQAQETMSQVEQSNSNTDNTNNGFMSTEDILNLVQNQQIQQVPKQEINSAAQADNYKDSQGRHSDSVPYNNISDKGHQDIIQNQGMAQHRDRYTSEEIAFLRQMQIDLDIKTPEEFGKYVHSWSKGKLSKKSDINPDNVTSFIEYIKSLGEN